MRIRDRLGKLEARSQERDEQAAWTYEERRVALLEIAKAVLTTDRPPAILAKAAVVADRIGAEIRAQAVRHAGQEFQGHLRNWVEVMWLESGRPLPFIPPLVGDEYDAWDMPYLAARRLAVRRRSSVMSVIGEPNVQTFTGLQPIRAFEAADVVAHFTRRGGDKRDNRANRCD